MWGDDFFELFLGIWSESCVIVFELRCDVWEYVFGYVERVGDVDDDESIFFVSRLIENIV